MPTRRVLLFACLLVAAPVRAADHTNIEEGLPTELQDAYPIAFRGYELQGRFRYERQHGGADQYLLQPRLEVGIAPNAQIAIGAPFLYGDASHRGSRELELDGLYNFNQESTVVPAFALAGRLQFPTGVESAGVDTRLTVVATKTLGAISFMPRLHLNATWAHEAGRADDERADRYIVILGYSMRVSPDVVLVADFVREQQLAEEAESNILEGGLRIQVTPQTVLVVGAGVGMGDESPDARATIGFQHSLSLPWLILPRM